MRKSIINLIGVPEEETQENGGEKISEVLMTENPPDLMSDITNNGRVRNSKTLPLR